MSGESEPKDATDDGGAEWLWGQRYLTSENNLAKRYMEIVARKQTAVILAADIKTIHTTETDGKQSIGMLELLDMVGPHVAVIKTHADLLDDWTLDDWALVVAKATQHDLIIMEDRKFADIGGISKRQMGGVYSIAEWADLVTSHLISGPDIVDGLVGAWDDVGRKGGVFLLAQMSSRGNLLEPWYTDRVLELGKENLSGVTGYIGSGSRPDILAELRQKAGTEQLIWTPGVNLATGDGELGQRYGDPTEAIIAGSDGIIVGGGIYRNEDPAQAANRYAEVSFLALQKRLVK